MPEKRWILNPEPSPQKVKELKTAINASDALAKLLIHRGIDDFEKARAFFNPTLSQLHSPFLMKDMDKAVQRITSAIENQENILVYGDYDVDGTSSVAMMYSFLITQSQRVSHYIPDRYDEGYGISFKGVDFAYDNDVTLIIALDCGIKEAEKVRYASEKQIDFIICDHHLPGSDFPPALAVLNPLRDDCDYPFKHLSGCGIGFKLIQALCKAWKLEAVEAYRYLDLVAIAAACDIVSMTGENRVMTKSGMELMESSLRPGLSVLFEQSGLAKDGSLIRPLTVIDLVFVIGPLINAAGRMAHGQVAVELLTATTVKAATPVAEMIIQNNSERREVDMQMLDEALAMLHEDQSQLSKKSTVLFAEHWHKGVVGIVASRVQDHFYRPTIVLTESNGKVSGSARSVRDFDVHEAIEKCADLLVNFGGHPAAAGLTLERNNLDEFIQRFEAAVAEVIVEDQMVPAIEIEQEIALVDITRKFFENINRMAPFGPDNMRPIFVTHNLYDTGNSRPVGADQSHLKIEVRQHGNNARVVKGIAFGMAHHHDRMKAGEPFSLAYVLEENHFNGRVTIELMVKDIKFKD